MLQRILPGTFYIARNKWRSWLQVPPTVAEVEVDCAARIEVVMRNPLINETQRRLLAEAEVLVALALMSVAKPNPVRRVIVTIDPRARLGYRLREVAA